MVALLDVNVLISLFDPAHINHEQAHGWFEANRSQGWATCPLTENALLRIVANPSYPGRQSTMVDTAHRLQRFRRSGHHVFWADSISFADTALFHLQRVQGYRQLTDVYLLGLALHYEGRLATFDRKISSASVDGASARHFAIIDG